jgi:hypothetical protein
MWLQKVGQGAAEQIGQSQKRNAVYEIRLTTISFLHSWHSVPTGIKPNQSQGHNGIDRAIDELPKI